jgi:hypothetical protein
LKKKLEPVFEDHRGIILDILEGESVDAITYISFKNRAIRANHYHKDTTQWNYVLSGKLKYCNKAINKDLLEDSLTNIDEETLYPGEKIEELLRKVDLASGANISKGRILGGSPTAITDAGTKRVGTGAIAANMAEFVANPGMFSAFRLARNLMGEKTKELSQEQLTDVAKLLMGEDPEVIKFALGNKDALEALTRRLIKAGQLVTGGAGSAAVVAGSKANPFSADFMAANADTLTEEDLERGDVNLSTYPPIVQSGEMSPEEWNASIASEENFESGALSNIASTIKPSARRKILDAANVN